MDVVSIKKEIELLRKHLDKLEAMIGADKAPTPPKKEIDAQLVDTAARVIGMLNAACGTDFKVRAKGNITPVIARLREGRTVEDFNRVINSKVNEWGKNDKMRPYLRPETLFGNKFESYLQAAKPMVSAESSYDPVDVEERILRRLSYGR